MVATTNDSLAYIPPANTHTASQRAEQVTRSTSDASTFGTLTFKSENQERGMNFVHRQNVTHSSLEDIVLHNPTITHVPQSDRQKLFKNSGFPEVSYGFSSENDNTSTSTGMLGQQQERLEVGKAPIVLNTATNGTFFFPRKAKMADGVQAPNNINNNFDPLELDPPPNVDVNLTEAVHVQYGNGVVSWNTEEGNAYQLLSSTNLSTWSPASWALVPASNSIPVVGGKKAEFFQVAAMPLLGAQILSPSSGSIVSSIANIDFYAWGLQGYKIDEATLLVDGKTRGRMLVETNEIFGRFQWQTSLESNGPHLIQIEVISSGEDGAVQSFLQRSAPTLVTLNNSIYANDWIGEVQANFALNFGTTADDSANCRMIVVDDLQRVWYDATKPVGVIRDNDGNIRLKGYIVNTAEYADASSFTATVEITPQANALAAPSTNSFGFLVNRRRFGTAKMISAKLDQVTHANSTSGETFLEMFAVATSEQFLADVAQYDFTDHPIDPAVTGIALELTTPSDWFALNLSVTHRDSIPPEPHTRAMTHLYYMGHGALNHFGWSPRDAAPKDVMNLRTTDLDLLTGGTGFLDFAFLNACYAGSSRILQMLVHPGEISLERMHAVGINPLCGMGWLKLRGTGFAGIVSPAWQNFTTDYVNRMITEDPGTGLPRSFITAYNQALAVSFTAAEAGRNLGFVGAKDIYFDMTTWPAPWVEQLYQYWDTNPPQ